MSDNLSRLAAVLGMMGSDHDGETLNAARQAEKMRKASGKTWADLIAGKSSSGSSAEYMMRALRAEGEVIELKAKLRATATEIDRLRASTGAAQPKPERASRWTSGGRLAF